MFPKLVSDILRHSSSYGLGASITTNGSWGRSVKAESFLEDFKELGLASVCISTSQFHQEFLPISTVVEAARMALRVGLHVTINVVSSAALSADLIKTSLGDLVGQVALVVMPCLPAGRADAMIRIDEYPDATPVPQGSCRRHFEKLAVDLDGNVWPCCSPGGFTKPLLMGNSNATPLDQIVMRSRLDPLLAVLDTVSPAFFLPFIREAECAEDLPARFSDQCHLCHAMLSSPRTTAVVRGVCERLLHDIRRLPEAERPPGRMSRIAAAMEPAQA